VFTVAGRSIPMSARSRGELALLFGENATPASAPVAERVVVEHDRRGIGEAQM